MSMSSMIDDLPGPQESPQEFISQQQETQAETQAEMHPKYINNDHINNNNERPVKEIIETFDQSPIKLEIKKKSSGILDDIKNEFNSNNLLILIILYISTMPESNEIIRKILSSFSNSAYSHMVVTILKCILLLLILILVRKFNILQF